MSFVSRTKVSWSLEDTPRPGPGPLGNRRGEHPAHQLGFGDSLRRRPPVQSSIYPCVYVKAGLLH